jgi:hypothetical protein
MPIPAGTEVLLDAGVETVYDKIVIYKIKYLQGPMLDSLP